MDSLVGKSTLDPTKNGSKSLGFLFFSFSPFENTRSALSFSVYQAFYQYHLNKSNL